MGKWHAWAVLQGGLCFSRLRPEIERGREVHGCEMREGERLMEGGK